MKQIQKLVSTLRLDRALLMSAILVVVLTPLAAVSAQSADTTVEELLKQINSRRDAQSAFFKRVFEDDPGSEKFDVATSSGNPYRPENHPGARISSKYAGNPILVMDKDSDNGLQSPDGTGESIPSGDSRLQGSVIFVLTEIQWGYEPDAEGVTQVGSSGDYTIYTFRNIYNPTLGVSKKLIDGGSFGEGALDTGDEARLVYTKNCQDVFTEDAWVSDLDIKEFEEDDGFDPPLIDDEDKEKIKDVAEAYNGPNGKLKMCEKNNSFFNDVMVWVMTAMKDMIDAVLGWIQSALLNVFDIGTLSDNQGLVNAWKTIRDFVNLVFILLLSVIAFSNILRVDTERYGLRALLPRLIFAVVAVNFSFMLVQIMTNVAFIISQPFVKSAFDLLKDPPADGSIIDPETNIGTFILSFIMVLLVIIGFVILFIFFVIRILMIWFLAALSPFVFLFMVLPLSRSIASMWWKNALKWIFMGPIAFVLLYIAAEVISATGGKNDDVNGPDFLLKIAFWLAACVAAVMVPLKLGGEIMQRGLGAAKGSGKLGGKLGGRLGLAAADRVPTRGGVSLGDRARAGLINQGLMKPPPVGSRAREKWERGYEHLQDQRALGRGVGRRFLSGQSQSQQFSAFDEAVADKDKRTASLGTYGQWRVAAAHAHGTVEENGKVYARDPRTGGANKAAGALNENELEMSKSRVASASAYKQLAKSGYAPDDLVLSQESNPNSLNRGFADTRYQIMHSDPMHYAIDDQGNYSHKKARAFAADMTPEQIKELAKDNPDNVIERAHAGDRKAIEVIAAMDHGSLQRAVDGAHRNAIPNRRRREQLRDVAAREGWADIANAYSP